MGEVMRRIWSDRLTKHFCSTCSVIVGTPDGITEVLRGKGWSEKVNCVVVDEVDECLRLHGEGLNKVMGRVLSGTFTGNRENDESR